MRSSIILGDRYNLFRRGYKKKNGPVAARVDARFAPQHFDPGFHQLN